MNKKEKLMKLVEDLLEIYPHLEGVLVEGSTEDPTKIVFTSRDQLEEIADEHGVEIQDIEEEQLDLLEFIEDDEDKGGGYLQ